MPLCLTTLVWTLSCCIWCVWNLNWFKETRMRLWCPNKFTDKT